VRVAESASPAGDGPGAGESVKLGAGEKLVGPAEAMAAAGGAATNVTDTEAKPKKRAATARKKAVAKKRGARKKAAARAASGASAPRPSSPPRASAGTRKKGTIAKTKPALAAGNRGGTGADPEDAGTAPGAGPAGHGEEGDAVAAEPASGSGDKVAEEGGATGRRSVASARRGIQLKGGGRA
jgi:hypothetical protein